ncbi:MAG: FKBP-type peptidyl-prolyl cis-trans isomerase [Myxococcota bacterium]|nr:FKBP-type peptidyl-prolyl cis-trans isomerase [Myxococcota bacterium]
MRAYSIGCLLGCLGLVQGCQQSSSQSKPEGMTSAASAATSEVKLDPQSIPGGAFSADNSPSPGVVKPAVKGLQTTASGLQWRMLRSGTGEGAKPGQKISIHYEAKLQGGKVYDSTHGKSPLTFAVGRSQLNLGMEEGIKAMTLGEKRVLMIPPKLAYGEVGIPGLIPPNSTLEVTVEIVGLLEEE